MNPEKYRRRRCRKITANHRTPNSGDGGDCGENAGDDPPALWGNGPSLCNSQSVVKEYGQKYAKREQEHMVCLVLNTKNRVVVEAVAAIGGICSAIVEPLQIFKHVIRAGAKKFIIIHNHPSGGTKPTSEDIALTSKIMEGAHILDLKLLDHIIVGNGYLSMCDEGFLG